VSFLEALCLGFIQGLTEFLPVSSSGHLVLGRHVLGLDASGLAFDVVVHVATLIATLLYYRHTIRDMGSASIVFLRGSDKSFATLRANESLWLLVLVGAASVPTGLIGLTCKELVEPLFASPKISSAMLVLTGCVLLTSLKKPDQEKGLLAFGLRAAFLVGVVQGLAILPGISRSGSTIVCALLLGLNRESAARLSFLMAIPAILGALLLELRAISLLETELVLPMMVGFASALCTGLLALVFLVHIVKRGKLFAFSFYLIPVGVFGLLWLP
jgi:undecaprenyl-diphosphatase